MNKKDNLNKPSIDDYKQLGPPFKIFSEPNQLYQRFVNRYCQSKSKMLNCPSKDQAFKLANSFWDKSKKDSQFVEQYVASPPTLFFQKPKGTQQTINSFFSKSHDNMMKKSNVSLNPVNPFNVQEEIKNEELSKPNIRKSEEISGEKLQPQLKKMKLIPNIYNIKAITEYIFKWKKDLEPEIKMEIEKSLTNEIVLNESMYISITKYIEQKKIADELSTFNKETETQKQIQKLESELKDYSLCLLQVKGLKDKMKANIEQDTFANIIERNSLKYLEEELSQLKTQQCMHMVRISSSIALILPSLTKKISNIRYYKKASLTPEIYKSSLKFLCFNLNSSWDFANKLLNLIILEEGNIYPLDPEGCLHIINLFKDSDFIVTNLQTLYDFIFQGDKAVARSKTSKLEAFGTILIKIFPLMSFHYLNETYLIDVTKFSDGNKEVLGILLEILEYACNDLGKICFILH